MSAPKFTPGPWRWRDVPGAGLQISGTLPQGFKIAGDACDADGSTSYMTWALRSSHMFQIADERWVQFGSAAWDEMQRANAALIAAAPDLYAALLPFEAVLDRWVAEGDRYGVKRADWERARAALAKARGEEAKP